MNWPHFHTISTENRILWTKLIKKWKKFMIIISKKKECKKFSKIKSWNSKKPSICSNRKITIYSIWNKKAINSLKNTRMKPCVQKLIQMRWWSRDIISKILLKKPMKINNLLIWTKRSNMSIFNQIKMI